MALDSINNYRSAYDDFYAQQYFAQANQPQAEKTAFTGYYQQPAADTFQKSGGSGLSTGLLLGAAAGGATGAGTYFFGANPVNNGRFADEILKTVDVNPTEIAKNKSLELFAQQKTAILKKAGVPEGISLKTLQAYSESGMPSAFPKLNGKLTQAQAKSILEAAEKEIETIDIDKIAKDAAKYGKEQTLEYKTNKLSSLQSQKLKLEALADDADLEKFFKDNAKTFGIDGNETAIETEAKKLAAKYKNKTGAIADYTTQITNQENIVKTARETLNGKVASYYDDGAKALTKDAPEALTKAFKNFKWNKAVKGGGIAAAAGLVLGLLFGNNA